MGLALLAGLALFAPLAVVPASSARESAIEVTVDASDDSARAEAERILRKVLDSDTVAETLIVSSSRKRGRTATIDLGSRGVISVDAASTEHGDRVLVGDDLLVEEDEIVTGDAVSIGGSATILGKVMGSVVAVGGSVLLGDSAFVGEDAVSVGGDVQRSESAIVDGEVVQVGISGPFPLVFGKGKTLKAASAGSRILGLIRTIIFYLVLAAFAALAVYLGRNRIEHASDYLAREPLPAVLMGLFSPVLLVVAVVLLCLTIIGIPVALALIFLYPVFIFLGWVVTAHRLGHSMNPDEPTPLRVVFLGLAILSGLHILHALLKALGIGGFLTFAVGFAGLAISGFGAFAGLGAILGTRFRRAPVPGQALAPGAAPPAPPMSTGPMAPTIG
jgi:hypothetical protein